MGLVLLEFLENKNILTTIIFGAYKPSCQSVIKGKPKRKHDLSLSFLVSLWTLETVSGVSTAPNKTITSYFPRIQDQQLILASGWQKEISHFGSFKYYITKFKIAINYIIAQSDEQCLNIIPIECENLNYFQRIGP